MLGKIELEEIDSAGMIVLGKEPRRMAKGMLFVVLFSEFEEGLKWGQRNIS